VSALVPIVIGGVTYVAVTSGDGETGVIAPGPTNYKAPTPGATVNQSMSPPLSVGGGAKVGSSRQTKGGALKQLNSSLAPIAIAVHTAQPSYGTAQNPDPAYQAKLDALVAQAKAKFESMAAKERVDAAAKLNKDLKIDPPLTGKEDWQETSRRVSQAGGAILGSMVGGPVGALVGAYLGGKIADYLIQPLEELIEQISEQNWTEKSLYAQSADWGSPYKSTQDDWAKMMKLTGNSYKDANGFQYNRSGTATVTREQAMQLWEAFWSNQKREGYHGQAAEDRLRLNNILGYNAF
jgi:hypothetical protein